MTIEPGAFAEIESRMLRVDGRRERVLRFLVRARLFLRPGSARRTPPVPVVQAAYALWRARLPWRLIPRRHRARVFRAVGAWFVDRHALHLAAAGHPWLSWSDAACTCADWRRPGRAFWRACFGGGIR